MACLRHVLALHYGKRKRPLLTWVKPKALPRKSTPHLTNAIVFIVEYRQRKLKLGLPPAPRPILPLRPPTTFEWPTTKAAPSFIKLEWVKPCAVATARDKHDGWMQWPNLVRFKYRARSSWRARLKPNDWRLKRAKERQAMLMPEVEYSKRNPILVTETANEWTDELCITA
jgi:hypothetical protein